MPSLVPFVPDEGAPPRSALLIAPGGALQFLSIDHEGIAVARWLQRRGSSAYVLKYRVASTPDDDAVFLDSLRSRLAGGVTEVMAPLLPAAVADAERAIELLRDDGVEQVAFLGFSAGARMGAELVLHATGVHRPDLAALLYTTPAGGTVAPADAPPLFLVAAGDDPLGLDGTLALAATWRAAGRPVEHHVFERGGHGFGITPQGLPVDAWPELLTAWLAQRSSIWRSASRTGRLRSR